MLRFVIALAALSVTTSARAADADVVLFPDARSSDGSATDATGPLGEAIRDVLTAAKFFVPTGADVARVTGIDLDACATDLLPGCTSEALVSLPVRLALVLDVRRELGGALVVDADFFHEGTLEPTFEETLRVGSAADIADLALQVAQFARSASKAVGATPPEQRQAARRLFSPVEPTRAADAFALLRAAPVTTTPSEPIGPVGPEPDAEPAAPAPTPPTPREDLDAADVEEDVDEGAPENVESAKPTPQRWLAGVRQRHRDRTTSSSAWYAAARPHGGRALVELHVGATTSDVHRAATSLGALDAEGAASALFWVEGPRKGVAPSGQLAIGYAPSAWIDVTATVGLDLARDIVGVGLMAEGQDAPTVTTVPTTVPRPRVGARLRVWPVPTGLAKPFLSVGGEVAFVADWRFTTPGAEGFARPPGGVLPWILAGGGVSLDPTPRAGFLVGIDAAIPLGALSLTRTAGELVGPPPPLPISAGWALRPTLGVQLRF